MRLLIAATILISACSTAWGKDGIMVCPDKYDDVVYIKLTKNLFGKYEDLQQKLNGTWYSICEPASEHYTQYCEFLDEAVEVVKIYDKYETSSKTKTTEFYDFELQLTNGVEYKWNDQKNRFSVDGIVREKQCEMLANIK